MFVLLRPNINPIKMGDSDEEGEEGNPLLRTRTMVDSLIRHLGPTIMDLGARVHFLRDLEEACKTNSFLLFHIKSILLHFGFHVARRHSTDPTILPEDYVPMKGLFTLERIKPISSLVIQHYFGRGISMKNCNTLCTRWGGALGDLLIRSIVWYFAHAFPHIATTPAQRAIESRFDQHQFLYAATEMATAIKNMLVRDND